MGPWQRTLVPAPPSVARFPSGHEAAFADSACMAWRTTERCPECGRDHDGGQLCELCGHLFQVNDAPIRREASFGSASSEPLVEPVSLEPPRESETSPWIFLVLGFAAAPLFLVHHLTRFCAWFVSALVHEIGHSAVGWALGMPSIPAIRLDGHAMALHGPQLPFLVVLIAALLAHVAWQLSARTQAPVWKRAALAFVAATGYLGLAWSPLGEGLFLLGGHAGEAVFACVCLWRCLVGGWSSSHAERVLYAALGAYLIADNVVLGYGLAFDAGTRATYATNGSFGLTNDYLRLARELGLSIEALGLLSAAAFLATSGLLLLAVHGSRLRARALAAEAEPPARLS